jgi:HD superfamily phosphohydrolase
MSSNIVLHIRDPLYGFIGLNNTEKQLIDTPIFQRLRRIKQLSNTYLVYPGATHSRFEHSLGTLYLAQIVAKKLNLNEKDTYNLRLASLLHDIGHGPFSHTFETALKWINGEKYSHEDITKYIIEKDENIKSLLNNNFDEVIDILFNQENFMHEIISSDFDIDKMDYFRRDSYHLGVAYGTYDFDRLLLTCTLIYDDTDKANFGLEEKGMRAYESFRLARFNLWEQVYEHHARLIADDMFTRALKYALDDRSISKNNLTANNDKFIDYYTYLDDYSIQHEILSKSTSISKNLISDIRNRILYKRAYIVRADNTGIPNAHIRRKIYRAYFDGLKDYEIEISSSVGINYDDIIIHVQNTPIKGYSTSKLDPKPSGKLLIRMKNGEPHELDDESPLTIDNETIRRLYVFYKGNKIIGKKIREHCEKKFDSKSNYVD